jgi:hypothetical protein
MQYTLRLPALGAEKHDKNGGYVTFSLTTLAKMDRRVRGILYSLGGVKGANSVDAFFQVHDVFEGITDAVTLAKSKLIEKRNEYNAAANLLESGKIDHTNVDYESSLMKKATDLRYHFKRVTDQNGVARMGLRVKQVADELRATADRCDANINSHDKRAQKFVSKAEAIGASIEYLALKNGLFDDERYVTKGDNYGQRMKSVSDIISNHTNDAGIVE